jgi:hypothetical protein
VPLEILHFALVLFGGGTGFKRSQVSASARSGILFARVKPVLAGCQFTDHGGSPFADAFDENAVQVVRRVHI